jgi:hypothetical protein
MGTKGMKFDGYTYDPDYDKERLSRQFYRVFNAMKDGVPRTLAEIARITGDPEASISARLRDLRKPQFGGHIVIRTSRAERKRGLFEYQLLCTFHQPELQL